MATRAKIPPAASQRPSWLGWCGCAATCITVGLITWLLIAPRDNADVLAIANSYNGGGYCRLSDSGVPEKITFKGVTILSKSKDGSSYCCGFTFMVAMKAAKQRGLLKDKDPYQIGRFQREWYGSIPGTAEKEIVPAMEHLGIGRQIPRSEVIPGDFIVFQRDNGSGHSAIFLNWVREDGVITGFRYRSSQNWTLGIANYTEYFTTSGRHDPDACVNPNRFYVARLY